MKYVVSTYGNSGTGRHEFDDAEDAIDMFMHLIRSDKAEIDISFKRLLLALLHGGRVFTVEGEHRSYVIHTELP